jgi:hypothetical protein
MMSKRKKLARIEGPRISVRDDNAIKDGREGARRRARPMTTPGTPTGVRTLDVLPARAPVRGVAPDVQLTGPPGWPHAPDGQPLDVAVG